MNLTQLVKGKKAKVIAISSSVNQVSRQRLADLGFVPGSIIEIYLVGPLQTPVAFLVKGSVIALRKEQMEAIKIELLH